MATINQLYEALLKILPTDYPLTFSYVRKSKLSDGKVTFATNTGALYFRSAGDAEYRQLASGKYMMESFRVVLNLFTERGERGVLAGLDYCKRVCDVLDTTFNRSIALDDGSSVFIGVCNKIGNYTYIGPTDQGIATFSLTYVINFD